MERYDPHLDKWIEVKEMGQRRAGNGVSELHGCLYVVGEWMVFSSLIFYRTYNDSVTKQHRNITLHLGSSGISPKVCFCILYIYLFLFTLLVQSHICSFFFPISYYTVAMVQPTFVTTKIRKLLVPLIGHMASINTFSGNGY